MKIVVLRTLLEQAQGLQHLDRIPDDTLYVFPLLTQGGSFHSRNVPEPFEIMFLTQDLSVISQHRLTPQTDYVNAPLSARFAIEAKVGVLGKLTI